MWKKFRWTEDQRRKEEERKKDIESLENEERESEEKRRAAAKAAGDDNYKPAPKAPRPEQVGPNPPEVFGKDARAWNQWHISLTPKFLMADGELTRILHQTGVTQYIDLLSVHGSFVVKKGVPSRVPSTRSQAVTSPLVATMQKYYMQNFLQFIASYKEDDPTTHKKGMNDTKCYSIGAAADTTRPQLGHEYHERGVRDLRSRCLDFRVHRSRHGPVRR